MRTFFAAVLIGSTLLLMAACASTQGSGPAPADNRAAAVPAEDTAVYEGDGLSLMEAIEQSAEKIAADLPPGSRVAFAAWESPSLGLSDYIMEELTGALVDRRMEVADRQNLEYVYRELNLQMSGEVSDESARSIGKFLGADLVITGQLTELGGPYRYRASAINVESATRDSVTRLSVRGDAALRRMVTALSGQKTAVKASSYGEGKKSAPGTAGSFLDRGITLASQGEYGIAIEDFTEAIKLNSELSAAYMLRGRAYFASVSKVKDVGANFGSVTAFSTAGTSLSSAQQQAYDKAIADYTQAIRLDPNNAAAYTERGRVYTQKQDNDKAIADHNQAIRLEPNSAVAYANRGLAYMDKKDNDKAITDYNQAIRIDPNYARAYYNQGVAYSNKGDYDKAIADYNQAIRIDPNYAAAYTNRGVAYYNKGDYDKAITDYNQAIRLEPNSAVAYANRGLAYMDKKDNDKAIADYNQAIRLDPNYALAYNNRGVAYWNQGNKTQARADWSKALQLDPNNATARNNLANFQ